MQKHTDIDKDIAASEKKRQEYKDAGDWNAQDEKEHNSAKEDLEVAKAELTNDDSEKNEGYIKLADLIRM